MVGWITSFASAFASLTAGLILLGSLAGPAAAFETEYHVGPQDKLRIKVSEWRPATRELFEWAAVSGEFTINSTGVLSMPVVGTIPVENLTTAQIGEAISRRLKEAAGLVTAPAAAVEVAQYRPIYVVGAVEKPGEYAYRPGMSALQAVSIAGGFYRSETSLGRFERETIVAEGEIKVNETQLIALLLRRDRMVAEARKATTIAFSDDAMRYGERRQVEQGMAEERALFLSRQQAVKSQIDGLTQVRALLEDEVKALNAKGLSLQKQTDLVRRELDNINSLMSKGLAVSPRQLAVEQNLAQIESQTLDHVLATARARQEIARTDRNMADVLNQRETEINRDLRETQTQLKQTFDRIGSLKLLIRESSLVAPRAQAQQARDAARVGLSILRRQDGALREQPAEETSPVLPGDIVKIERMNQQAPLTDISLGGRQPASAAAQN